MLDFIEDDHLTIRHDNYRDLPQWFLNSVLEILNYYDMTEDMHHVLNHNSELIQEYFKKKGLIFETFKFDNGMDYLSKPKVVQGYVFKSTPELSAHIIRLTESS